MTPFTAVAGLTIKASPDLTPVIVAVVVAWDCAAIDPKS